MNTHKTYYLGPPRGPRGRYLREPGQPLFHRPVFPTFGFGPYPALLSVLLSFQTQTTRCPDLKRGVSLGYEEEVNLYKFNLCTRGLDDISSLFVCTTLRHKLNYPKNHITNVCKFYIHTQRDTHIHTLSRSLSFDVYWNLYLL